MFSNQRKEDIFYVWVWNHTGIQELEKLKANYYIFYHSKIENKEYSGQEMNEYLQLLEENFYTKGVINCPIIEDKMIIDHVDLIQKSEEKLLQNIRIKYFVFWEL